MEKKFNIVVGEDGTVKLPDAVLEKLEVKPGEEVRFEVDDNFYAVRLLSFSSISCFNAPLMVDCSVGIPSGPATTRL